MHGSWVNSKRSSLDFVDFTKMEKYNVISITIIMYRKLITPSQYSSLNLGLRYMYS